MHNENDSKFWIIDQTHVINKIFLKNVMLVMSIKLVIIYNIYAEY